MNITLGEEPISTFTQAVKRTFDLAMARLPQELHGHLERAHALVLHRHVWLDEDGRHAQVLSSDGQTWYVCNGHCTCMDAPRAPQGLCKHKLAVHMYRRASELLAQSGGGTGASVAPCPEALFSACLRGTVRGIDTQLTARGMTLDEFQRHFDAVHALFDVPPARPASATPAQPTPGETPVCPHHGKSKESTKATGTFFCPSKMADGTYCQWRHPAK
jgi:hypothetical protein